MPHEAIDEDILFAPVRDLAGRIRAGRLSPVALTEACLDRLETVGPRLGAVVTVLRDAALREARAADAEVRAGRYRGVLHGIPYGAKDLLAARGAPTTWGAAPFRRQAFDHDATVIRKLRDAGAILVAKLALVELAGAFGYDHADASFTGPARTPWNRDYWAGGSSSGSAAAVAAGLVPFALGSETSGSIITPAAYSGVSGLRPTYGRVSRAGAMALSWTLDKIGPLCRTADDCGLVLAAIAGRDPKDPSSADRPFRAPDPARPAGRRFRVGVVRGCTRNVQPAVRANFERALAVLADFCDITADVPLPDLPFGPAVSLIIDAEGACSFRDLIESGRIRELRTPGMAAGGVAGAAILAVDYLQALRVRGVMKKALDRTYAPYDALVAPSRGTVSYPVDRNFSAVYRTYRGGPPLIPAGNLAGQPALSVLSGFGPHGLPTGVQFTGAAWSEGRLIALANQYQRATDWQRRRPPRDPGRGPAP